MSIQAQIKEAADALKAKIKPLDTVSHLELDEAAQPLFKLLRQEGYVDDISNCYVEPQGIWEFDLVPVCHSGGALNVHRDGSVERF